jgi:cytochrome c-type biogenesis protein CcmH/NrfG
VSEQVAQLSGTTDQLATIEILLIAILVATIVSACAGVLRLVMVTLRNFRTIWDDFFRDEAKRLLDSDEIDELVRHAKGQLAKHPNHVYAHWYLGRAYYLQEKWAEAIEEFREVARIDPSWIDDHVKPYVRAIERKSGTETVH